MEDKVAGLIIGCAVADAMGSIVQQSPGEELETIDIEHGYWQESTSSFLALINTLYSKTIDFDQVFSKNLNDAYYTSNGILSNLDNGTYDLKINGYRKLDHSENDTGSLVRTAAVALYYYNDYKDLLYNSQLISHITHDSRLCSDACKLFSAMLDGVLHGHSKKEILAPIYYDNITLHPDIRSTLLSDVDCDLSGDSVINVLESVIACFKATNNFSEGLKLIIKISTCPSRACSLYGQIAGAYYGLTDIKLELIDELKHTAPLLEAIELYKLNV